MKSTIPVLMLGNESLIATDIATDDKTIHQKKESGGCVDVDRHGG